MDHFIDIYKKKKYGPAYCEDLLNLSGIKINLKVDGKPFQVLYNEETDEIEWHGRSGNETTIGPLIDDYTRLFSKPVNDAIAHIEPRKEVFKKYKFLTFEVIDTLLLLTAVIDKNDEFINDASEIKKIADELDTDVMPTLWEGKLSDEQKNSILQIISTAVVPERADFIKWVTDMFSSYKAYPKKLISASDEFIEGIVFFFEKDSDIIEYKLVDPTYRQSMKDRDAAHDKEREARKEHYEAAYNLMVDWLEKNAEKLDNNQVTSLQKNFVKMAEDSSFSKMLNAGKGLEENVSQTYTIQLDRTIPEVAELIKQHGQPCKNLIELFIKTFYKEKKRAFIISPEFQAKINKICGIIRDGNVSEALDIFCCTRLKSITTYINEKLN